MAGDMPPLILELQLVTPPPPSSVWECLGCHQALTNDMHGMRSPPEGVEHVLSVLTEYRHCIPKDMKQDLNIYIFYCFF